jgi:hypothetical protein
MTTLSLIERLEGAERGSTSLGRDVLVELGVVERIDRSLYYGVGNEDVWHYGAEAEKEGVWRMLPDPTTSLDAALAMAERVLPGWDWLLRTDEERGFMLNCWKRGDEPNLGDPCFPSFAPTPALALCIAILRARKDTL